MCFSVPSNVCELPRASGLFAWQRVVVHALGPCLDQIIGLLHRTCSVPVFRTSTNKPRRRGPLRQCTPQGQQSMPATPRSNLTGSDGGTLAIWPWHLRSSNLHPTCVCCVSIDLCSTHSSVTLDATCSLTWLPFPPTMKPAGAGGGGHHRGNTPHLSSLLLIDTNGLNLQKQLTPKIKH